VQGIKKFLSSPSREILETLRNHLEMFVKYIEVLLGYYARKHSEDFCFKAENPDRKCFDLLAKVSKVTILVHRIGKKTRLFDPVIKQENKKKKKAGLSKLCINLLQISKNQFCVLYEEPPVEIVEPSANFFRETCQICNRECQEFGGCGQVVHKKCVSDSREEQFPVLPQNSDLKQECTNCGISKHQSSFHGTSICHNCIVIKSLSDDPSFSTQVLKCLSCDPKDTFPLYPTDFVPVLCPDNHDFLCRACWSNSLQRNPRYSVSERKNRFLCPYNKKIITDLSRLISKMLEESCLKCNERNTQFFGRFSCANCIVCTTCQNEANRKTNKRFKCPVCSRDLEEKSEPWKISWSLNSLDE